MCNTTTTMIVIVAACIVAYLWHMRSNGKRLIHGVSNRMLIFTVVAAVVVWLVWTKNEYYTGIANVNSEKSVSLVATPVPSSTPTINWNNLCIDITGSNTSTTGVYYRIKGIKFENHSVFATQDMSKYIVMDTATNLLTIISADQYMIDSESESVDTYNRLGYINYDGSTNTGTVGDWDGSENVWSFRTC